MTPAARAAHRAAGTISTSHPNQRRSAMPLINVKLIEDVFTSEQKGQIVERLTDAMVSIEGENMRGVTWVVIEDVRSGDWGIGGQALTTEADRALAGGKAYGAFSAHLRFYFLPPNGSRMLVCTDSYRRRKPCL